MRSLIMALVATLFVGSAVGAHAQTAAHQPSYKKHLPGVFEYLKDAAGHEVGFKCNWPYDQHCATIQVAQMHVMPYGSHRSRRDTSM